MQRRTFLAAGIVATGTYLGLGQDATKPLQVACNAYPWMTFARRENREWRDVDSLAEVARSGVHGFEPIAESPEHIAVLVPLLKKHSLAMHSLYVNSLLHDPAQAPASMDEVVSIAKSALALGTKIIVTNPSPIRWGGPENKSDAQLLEQARNLEILGQRLRDQGQTLAYHNHDAELREGGREFHHMLAGTDPELVKLCLDAHWIYRGCGNSEVAVFDALTLYHPRIVELHLRQSLDGTWTESFSPNGDIDYGRLMNFLTERGFAPHLVLEQAVETNTPRTLSAVDAHLRSVDNLAKLFPH